MSTFYLYWLDGKRETIQGNDITDAFRRAGHTGGALRSLDFWTMGNNDKIEYVWDTEKKKWNKILHD